jgi:DNA replication protein DnaC
VSTLDLRTVPAEWVPLVQEFFASIEDPAERAELEAIFVQRFEEGRQRALLRELTRPEPTLDGAPFQPRSLRHDWAHDGTELWDVSPQGKSIPHGVGYRCLVCRDARFVRRDVPVGHPDFGQAFPCKCQREDAAFRAALLRERFARAGLAPALTRCTFESFEALPGATGGLNAAYAVVEAHRQAVEAPRWLALHGPPGTGKTHLLTAALQHMLPLTEGVGATLGSLLAACKRDGFARDEEITQRAIGAPVLLLDEVGAHSEGDWAREKVERILNARYEARAWTLLGLTVAPPNVEAWSPRIASRLSDRRLVVQATLTCGDYRRRES